MVKERVAIISSMAAVATFLVGIVLLIQTFGIAKHDHKYALTLVKTETGFNVLGRCASDDCEEPEYLEENVEDVVEDTSPGNCSSEGQTEYSVTRFGETVSYVEYGERSSHTLNGVAVNTLLNEDGSINYDVAGVSLFDNTAYSCGSANEGYFVCESCNATVVVKVHKPHVGEFITETNPTCTEAGKMTAKCVNCDEMLMLEQEIPALGHEYTYSIEPASEAGKMNVKRTCTREGCKVPSSTELSVELTLIASATKTCNSPDWNKYSYVKDGETIEFTVYGEVAHKFSGKKIFEGENVDYGAAGLHFFGTPDFTGGEADGYVICEECGELVRVSVLEPLFLSVTGPAYIGEDE